MGKFKTLFLIFLNILLISAQKTSILTENCIEHEIPSKETNFQYFRFGVLTTTYIRSGSTKMFSEYLERYAESECDAYDNIYIIWNNQESPEEMGVLATKDKWKKNVYFMQTVENSLDFKYIIPTWANEKIFFSMDDDFDISCETLKKGFQAWQESSYGEVGPLTAFYGRSYVFEPQTQSFTYIDQIKLNKKWNYYHFGLTGISFISRHFMELYYADIFQLKEMRKHVVEKFNCEDLLLNFMVSYLYPEVTPKYIELPFKSLGISGVSATAKHKSYRAECITKFSDIIGYNPVRYVQAKTNNTLMEKKTNLQESCLVNLKQEHYEKTLISNRAYYLYIKRITGVDNDFIRDENVRLLEAKENIVSFMEKRKQEIEKPKKDDSNVRSEGSQMHGVLDNERKMLEGDEMMMHFGTKEQIDKFTGKFPKTETVKTELDEVITSEVHQETSVPILREEISNQLISVEKEQTQLDMLIEKIKSDDLALYLAIFSVVLVFIFCIKKFIFDKAQKSYENLPIGTEA